MGPAVEEEVGFGVRFGFTGFQIFVGDTPVIFPPIEMLHMMWSSKSMSIIQKNLLIEQKLLGSCHFIQLLLQEFDLEALLMR